MLTITQVIELGYRSAFFRSPDLFPQPGRGNSIGPRQSREHLLAHRPLTDLPAQGVILDCDFAANRSTTLRIITTGSIQMSRNSNNPIAI
jgi:hypothetical protein